MRDVPNNFTLEKKKSKRIRKRIVKRKIDRTKSRNARKLSKEQSRNRDDRKRTWFFATNGYIYSARMLNRRAEYIVPQQTPIQLLENKIAPLNTRKEISKVELQSFAKDMVNKSLHQLHINIVENYYKSLNIETFIETIGYIQHDILIHQIEVFSHNIEIKAALEAGLNISLIRRDLTTKKHWLTRQIVETNQFKKSKNDEIKLPNPISYFTDEGKANSQYLTFRPLTENEELHLSIPIEKNYISNKIKKKIGTMSIVDNIGQFKRNFSAFTNGIFDNIKLHNAYIGGSCMPACLSKLPMNLSKLHHQIDDISQAIRESLPLPLELIEIIISMVTIEDENHLKRNLQSYFTRKSYSTADIDIFFTGNSRMEAFNSITNCYHQISEELLKNGYEFKVVRTNNAITICTGHPVRNIQLILLVFQDIRESLNFSDMDCTAVVYDGQCVYGTERSIRSYNTRWNFIPPATMTSNDERKGRISKYQRRGFGTLLFELCKHQPRCDIIPTQETYDSIASTHYSRYNSSSEWHYDSYVVYFEGCTLNIMMENLAYFGDHLKQKNSEIPWIVGDTLEDVMNFNDFSVQDNKLKPLRWKREAERDRNLFLFPKCYMCKKRGGFFEQTKAFNRIVQICDDCRQLNEAKRNQKFDMNGKIALITGGRIKIGYSCALQLLRCGALVIITTRFPYDANKRFKQEDDYLQWKNHLHIYGIDFRHLESVNHFITHIKQNYSKLDILINNAAQTIHRPPAYYEKLSNYEKYSYQLANNNTMSLEYSAVKNINSNPFLQLENSIKASENSQQLIGLPSHSCNHSIDVLRNISIDSPIFSSQYVMIPVIPSDHLSDDEKAKFFPDDQFDEHNEPIDLRSKNTWNSTVEEVHPVELVEVQVVNSIVPSLLLSSFHDLLKKSPLNQENSFVINVTSSEGQFSARKYNGHHVHTNMAKASLNMLTLSVAENMAKDCIYVNCVDTGWVTKMTPGGRQTENSAIAPLSPDDGAARILDPIFDALINGNYTYGHLYKDFMQATW